jgi:hypothetical protein
MGIIIAVAGGATGSIGSERENAERQLLTMEC